MLPGEADAAEGLERVAAHEALTVVAGGLGHGDGGGPGGRVLVDGGDGEVAQGAGTLEGEEHVAHLVLDRLEGADGHPELLAVLDVGQHHLEERVAGADGLERERDGRLLQGAGDPERGGRAAGLAERPVVGDEDTVERGGGEGPARIERVHGGRPASAAGTTKAPMPSPTRAMTATRRCRRRPGGRACVPCRTQPPSARSAAMVTSSSAQPAGWSASATAPGDGAGGDLRRGSAGAARGCRPPGPSGRTG